MNPDQPNEEERLEQLPQDDATPFQPAGPNPDSTSNTSDPVVQAGGSDLPDDHPATDDKMDETELYDEGVAGAAEVNDHSDQSAVTDYTSQDSNVEDSTL